MKLRVYAGLFVIAAAALALEVTLTRLLSVMLWYHLSFFAVAAAMLGMTAGATTVFLRANRYEGAALEGSVARACVGFAVATPLCLIGLLYFPAVIGSSTLFPLVVFDAVVSFVPFYFAGVAVTAVLTRHPLPVGRLYAADLLGAALGSLVVLGGIEVLDAPSLIIVIAALGAIAGALFANRPRVALLGLALVGLATFTATTSFKLRPISVKGVPLTAADIWFEKWNSFSRIVVYPPVERVPQLWGPSDKAPTLPILQYRMNIDGEAATTVRGFHSLADLEHLKFDVTNVAYQLGRKGKALVIGVGGGRDVQSALLFGQSPVIGVELNPIFVHLLEGPLASFAGLAGRADVKLTVDEGRGFVARSKEKFSTIQMSLIDTWAATGAGAFTLSENGLYTVEAWRTFIDHLEDDGVFTVSRWYDDADLGETGRLLSLASAALFDAGVAKPSEHLALISCKKVTTLILSKKPFSEADLGRLESVAQDYDFDLSALPGKAPPHPVLASILAATSRAELDAVADGQVLNFSAPTDESPYFFNMLRLDHLDEASKGRGVLRGNLLATNVLLTLMAALALTALLTIIVPLWLRRAQLGSLRNVWAGALYFSLIGAGFMFVEIALIQRLSVYLSHPVYALGVLLFAIISSTGLGALASERLPLDRGAPMYLFPLVTLAAILGERWLLPDVITSTQAAPMFTKAALSVITLFPMGLLLGLSFPIGMRVAKRAYTVETPWFWALNGVFSVLVSSSAVFVSIYAGVSKNFYLSAACYALTLIALHRMNRLKRAAAT